MCMINIVFNFNYKEGGCGYRQKKAAIYAAMVLIKCFFGPLGLNDLSNDPTVFVKWNALIARIGV